MQLHLPLFIVFALVCTTAAEQVQNCPGKQCRDWAQCVEINGTFQCVCDGRAGPQCEMGSDPCLNHLCANGASCIIIDERPFCQCTKEWLGYRCELRNPCLKADVCSGHGTCKVVITDQFNGIVESSCDCEPQWMGKHCQKRIRMKRIKVGRTPSVFGTALVLLGGYFIIMFLCMTGGYFARGRP